MGLICMGRRYYDPRLGRFISPDRVVPGIYQLDGWNRYHYAHNNPLRYIDPSGINDEANTWAIFLVAVVVVALLAAGLFTGGATWMILGIAVNSSGLLIGTAIGVAGGAIIGGLSAKNEDDVWKGILFGAFVGGVSSFVGGVLSAGVMGPGIPGRAPGAGPGTLLRERRRARRPERAGNSDDSDAAACHAHAGARSQ